MADLNALIAQGAQFHAPIDPFAQYARMQQLEQGQQANMLNRMKMDEYQRGLQEQEGVRNYLRATPAFDPANPTHQAGLMQVAPTTAPKLIESFLTAKKTSADIAKTQTETTGKDFENRIAKANKAISDIAALKSSDEAVASIDQHLAAGDIDQAKADSLKQGLANEPVFSRWQNNMLKGIMSAKEQLEFSKPNWQLRNVGDKSFYEDTNANSPTFGQQRSQEKLSMTEYEKGHLATQQRQAATAEARLKFEKENPGFDIKEQADGSLVGINKRTLESKPVTDASGKPVAGAAKPLTEGQGSSVAYGMRMAESDKILRDLEGKGLKDTGLIRAGLSGTVGAIPLIGESLGKGVDNVFNVLPSVMGGLSPEQQKTMQARVNFITAVLRKESGASISPSEFATAEKNYFPAPGDNASVLKQKQDARQTAIKAMKVQAGPSAGEIDKHVSGLGGGGVDTSNPLLK